MSTGQSRRNEQTTEADGEPSGQCPPFETGRFTSRCATRPTTRQTAYDKPPVSHGDGCGQERGGVKQEAAERDRRKEESIRQLTAGTPEKPEKVEESAFAQALVSQDGKAPLEIIHAERT